MMAGNERTTVTEDASLYSRESWGSDGEASLSQVCCVAQEFTLNAMSNIFAASPEAYIVDASAQSNAISCTRYARLNIVTTFTQFVSWNDCGRLRYSAVAKTDPESIECFVECIKG